MRWDPEDVRRYLRETRTNPPGQARVGNRKAVYCAALEQFEQLLRAARQVSAIARPLPLFYALSQATRAVVAAHKPAHVDWRIRSHGISWRTGGSLLESGGTFEQDGAFPELCEVFNCRREGGAVTFGGAWAASPDLSDIPLPGQWLSAIEVEPFDPPTTRIGTRHGIDEMPPPDGHLDQYILTVPDGTTEAALVASLSDYPQCPSDYEILALAQAPGHPVRLGWPKDLRYQHVRSGATLTMGPRVGVEHLTGKGRWLLPQIGGGLPLDVLPLWWVLLFALSNYARYSPEQWSKAMDVDRSHVAARLETMMNRAMEQLPILVLQSVRQVWHRDQPDNFVLIKDTENEQA